MQSCAFLCVRGAKLFFGHPKPIFDNACGIIGFEAIFRGVARCSPWLDPLAGTPGGWWLVVVPSGAFLCARGAKLFFGHPKPISDNTFGIILFEAIFSGVARCAAWLDPLAGTPGGWWLVVVPSGAFLCVRVAKVFFGHPKPIFDNTFGIIVFEAIFRGVGGGWWC
jgi:hypothetical protein